MYFISLLNIARNIYPDMSLKYRSGNNYKYIIMNIYLI